MAAVGWPVPSPFYTRTDAKYTYPASQCRQQPRPQVQTFCWGQQGTWGANGRSRWQVGHCTTGHIRISTHGHIPERQVSAHVVGRLN